MSLPAITAYPPQPGNIRRRFAHEITLELELAEFVGQRIQLSFGHIPHQKRLMELQSRADSFGCPMADTEEL
jgi:hypothetical protein